MTASPPRTTRPTATAPGTRRVILAEDDADMRHMLAGVLGADGWEVVEAPDGNELIDRLHEIARQPHGRDSVALILADVRMPRLDGLDVLAALRCAGWYTPVILMTAFGDDATHAEAKRLGAVEVLDKPFGMEALRALVRRVAPARVGQAAD